LGDISSESRDLFNDPRTQKNTILSGSKKNRLNLGLNPAICQSHLKLEFKVGNGAQPPYHHKCLTNTAEIDEKPA
jgi:hypothetical protein